MTLLLLALFCLGAELLPSLTEAGTALWLAPLLALPLVLLGLFLAFRGKSPQDRNDFGMDLPQVLGSFGTKLAAFVFLLWALFVLCMSVVRCAARLGLAEGSPILFAALVMALALWMSSKRLSSFVRACEIFYLIIAVALVGVLIMGAPRLEPDHLFLFSRTELTNLPHSILSVLGLFSVGLFTLFLSGGIAVRKGDAACCYRRTSLLFCALSLLLLLILGTFGAPLVGKMDRPFLQMVAALGVEGAFQRLEALFSALWMLGDLALFTMLLFSVKRLSACVTGGGESNWAPALGGAAALIGAALLAGQEGVLLWLRQSLLPWGGLIFAALMLLLFLGLKRKRGKEKKVPSK